MKRRLGGLVLLAFLVACHPARADETILFVCQFGSVKSAITRELFRRRAAERGISVTAISRGITPEKHMDPALSSALAGEGIDPARDPLQGLDQTALKGADIVVVFDKLPPAFGRTDVRDWTDTPSMVADYRRAREVLDPRIEALLSEIQRVSGKPGPPRHLPW
jgi:protein-tyrosine-phosphatase